jgi:Cft2 family RNA processing exonuclease
MCALLLTGKTAGGRFFTLGSSPLLMGKSAWPFLLTFWWPKTQTKDRQGFCRPIHMKCLFLGGAEEVGASCALLELGTYRFLVDCGIRMGSSPLGNLPDFSLINDFKPQAVFLTHAHMDHSGSLPLYLASCPDVPVFVTPPTQALLKILFADALKIMDGKGGEEIPLYSDLMVEACLNRMSTVPFDHPLRLFGGEVTAIFRPAGHILGAATLALASSAGKVLFTGDYSFQPQKTVGGAAIPREKFDLVVTEATYGARFHPPRAEEEKRLAQMVAERVRQGGFVLIPAFAIGRAQEVLLTLAAEMSAGRIPEFPVFADGMVTRVCHAYADFPNDVSAFLQKRLKKLSHPFFPAEGMMKPVFSAKDRTALLQGPPAAIVASSGMLTGGPSVYYAGELAGRKETMIAVTGYQDEESPGRKLLELAVPENSTRVLQLGKVAVSVSCRIATFGLSAHADGQEISRFLSRLAPEHVALVHGDDGAREELWGTLKTVLPGAHVHLPKRGEFLEFSIRGPRKHRPNVNSAVVDLGLGQGKWPVDEGDLHLLRNFVLDRFGHERFFTCRELFTFFCGPEQFSAEYFERFRSLIRESTAFVFLKNRPFLFHAVPDKAGNEDPSAGSGFMEQNAALNLVRGCFGPADRFLRAGFLLEVQPPEILLVFAFPEAARSRLTEQFDRIAAGTGFQVRLDPETRIHELTKLLGEILPQGLRLARNPSFFPERKAMVVRVEDDDVARILSEKADWFRGETGIDLTVEMVEAVSPIPASGLSRIDTNGRMEINAAYQLIDSEFRAFPGVLLKRGKKAHAVGEFVELSFVTPKAGERYRETITWLERATGWEIRISRAVNQNVLCQMLAEILRPHGTIQGNPSIHAIRKQIVVRMKPIPSPESLAEILCGFQRETGFFVEIKG